MSIPAKFFEFLISQNFILASVIDAVGMGVAKLPSMDPFADIDPPIKDTVLSAAANLKAVSSISEAETVIGYARSTKNEDDSVEDEWMREEHISSKLIDGEVDD